MDYGWGQRPIEGREYEVLVEEEVATHGKDFVLAEVEGPGETQVAVEKLLESLLLVVRHHAIRKAQFRGSMWPSAKSTSNVMKGGVIFVPGLKKQAVG